MRDRPVDRGSRSGRPGVRHADHVEPPLLDLVREDWRAHSPRPLAKPGFHAMVLHRFGFWQRRLPPTLQLPARVVHDALYFVTRVLYGIEVPRLTKVGRRVVIAHQGGIVIGWGVEIGDDCLIRQNVTIGAAETGGSDPRIGNRVDIGAGAVIIGGITVGDDVRIGPNTVVTSDVPPGSRVVAPPARILAPREASAAAIQPRAVDGARATAAGIARLVEGALELDEPISEDMPLLSSGLVDSLNLVVLLDALERVYGVEIPSEAVTVEEFDTPEQIASAIGEYRR